MSRHILFVAIALLWSIPAFAQAPADLVQAIRERDQAIDKEDAPTWDRLTTDDFTVVLETGRLMTKAERLAEIRKAKPAATLTSCQQESLRIYGDTAVQRCREGNTRVINVWVRSPTGWRAAAVQVTTVTGK